MSDPYQQMVSRLIRHFGRSEKVTLRKTVSLRSRITGGSASPLLKTALAGGESSFTIDGGLTGIVPSSTVVTLDGVDYTTTSSAEASGGEITLTVTPVIAGAVAENEPVTIAASVDYTFERVRSQFSDQQSIELGDAQGTRDMRVVHLVSDVSSAVPEVGDLLVESDGNVERVTRVKRLGPLLNPAGWTVWVGEAS